MMFFVMMVMFAVVANAQYITKTCPMDGLIYMSDGSAMDYDQVNSYLISLGLPGAGHLHTGETLQENILRMQRNKNSEIIRRRGLDTPYSGYGMYGGVGMAMTMPIFGGNGKFISLGNEHWNFTHSESNFGGYKTSATGVKVGSFDFQIGSSGYQEPTATASTGCYTRGTASSASYETQKKADTKKASAAYSMKKNNVAASGNTRSTSYTSYNNVKEVNINDLMRCYK